MTLTIVEGDLLAQNADAIVNAWNRNIIPWWMLLPQGVSGAIKRAGGVAPFRELGNRPLPLGGARHTGAGRLPFRGIIHVAAIDAFWRASEDSIARGTRAACELASERGYRSLAMPVLGSGSGGYDLTDALEVMTHTLHHTESQVDVTIVRFTR